MCSLFINFMSKSLSNESLQYIRDLPTNIQISIICHTGCMLYDLNIHLLGVCNTFRDLPTTFSK